MENKNKQNMSSEKRIKRLRAQGYQSLTNYEVSELALGHRFAIQLCTALLTISLVTSSLHMLTVIMGFAFLGAALPNHPFDHIYNYIIAVWMNKPRLPKRSVQFRFSCGIAGMMTTAIIYFFYSGYAIAGYVTGSVLLGVAITVSTTDFCIPSQIFNVLIKKK